MRFQSSFEQLAGDLVLGLWRPAAPASVETFMSLVRGTLAPIEGDEPASYERSVVVRISKDKEVVLGGLKKQGGQTMLVAGQTRPKIVPVQPPFNDDSNGAMHSAAGLISMRKGGGSFEFSISTRADPALDAGSIIIGQVLEGMELLERVNTVPTNNCARGQDSKQSISASKPLDIAVTLAYSCGVGPQLSLMHAD